MVFSAKHARANVRTNAQNTLCTCPQKYTNPQHVHTRTKYIHAYANNGHVCTLIQYTCTQICTYNTCAETYPNRHAHMYTDPHIHALTLTCLVHTKDLSPFSLCLDDFLQTCPRKHAQFLTGCLGMCLLGKQCVNRMSNRSRFRRVRVCGGRGGGMFCFWF